MSASRTAPDRPPFLTVDEVAALLRLNRRTVLRLVERGELPAARLGKLYRFDPAKIAALFDSSKPS